MWSRIRSLTSVIRSVTLHELRTSTDIKGTIETKNSIITGGFRLDAHVLPKPVKGHNPFKSDKSFENVSSNKSS